MPLVYFISMKKECISVQRKNYEELFIATMLRIKNYSKSEKDAPWMRLL